MTFDEMVQRRRSVRKYQDVPVERALLDQVLEAGRLAPSATNAQTWHFTLVENAALRDRLAAACCGQGMVAQAPLDLVVWSDGDRQMACGQSAATVDCSIALSFMMLKATELGLGTCWLGAFHADEVAHVLGLPESAVVVAVSPLGWPAEVPAARPRKALSEVSDLRA